MDDRDKRMRMQAEGGMQMEMDTTHAHGEAMAGMGHGGRMMDMGALRRRFWVCLVLAIPVVLLAPMEGMAMPFQLAFPGSGWVVLGLATALYFYGGAPFLSGARGELASRRPAMMTLISLGITVAYLYSVYAFLRNTFAGTHLGSFFSELATLVVVMLLGHWVEMRALGAAGDALEKLAELLPATATVVAPGGGTRDIPLASLKVGESVLVPPGGRVPADGVVTDGRSAVDESLVTGEAKGVEKQAGDTVIGGAQNGMGRLTVKVTGTGESGYLSQVMQLVDSARQQKSHAETVSDRVAGWLFYIAVAVGVVAFAVWLLVGAGFSVALTRLVAVLVIACPHALGLAVPLVTARATSLGAKRGLLVKNRQALEAAPQTDILVMDKTGTLTEGRFQVADVQSLGGYTQDQVLATAAALEQGSGHPLAAGILRAAQQRGVSALPATNIRAIPGVGVEGRLRGGQNARLVSAAALDKENVPYDEASFKALSGKGFSTSYLLVDGRVEGLIAQGDAIKPGAKGLVADLQAHHIRPVMLTGDNPRAARTVAGELGIHEYRAGLLPEDKQGVVRSYQQNGRTVMMVGDGINDAPGLAAANVGVAVGAGTQVAIGSADVVLVRSEPGDISGFLGLAKATRRKMRQNLWWGAGYNIIALPLAAGALAPWGITLAPAVGALLMSLSTIIVAVNALTLHIKE